MSVATRSMPFFGWRAVWAAFILAVFGWGVGFYGPPIFLHAVVERTGWSLTLVSSAITVHFLIGVVVVANLARLYRRFGVPIIMNAGALLLALAVLVFLIGWQIMSLAHELMYQRIAFFVLGLALAGNSGAIAPVQSDTQPSGVG